MIKSQVGSSKRSKAILEPSNRADKTLRMTESNYEAFLLARRHIKSRRIFIEDIVMKNSPLLSELVGRRTLPKYATSAFN